MCICLAGLLLMAYSLWEIAQVPGLLQYVVRADAEISSDAPAMLRQRIDMLEGAAPALEQVVAAYTLTGSAPQVALSAEQTGAEIGRVHV